MARGIARAAEPTSSIGAQQREQQERFALVGSVYGTPLVALLDGSRDSAYYSTLYTPLFYGAGAAFRWQLTYRIGFELGARYDVLTSAQMERRAIERGVSIPLRLAILVAGSRKHGLELSPELSYQYVWTDRQTTCKSQGAGMQLVLGYRLQVVERLRFRVELGGRWDGGGFRSGEDGVADGGRSRLSIPLALAFEIGL